MIQIDQEFFLWLNNLGTPFWDPIWMGITNKYNSFPLYVILLVVAFRTLGTKKGLWLLLTVALMILFTDQMTNLFKSGVGRFRPCHDPDIMDMMRLVKPNCGGFYGYFSGHSSNSFAVAVFFYGLLNKYYRWVSFLFVWASLVAYSRIYVGVHYPLDILSGALFGSLAGWGFLRIYKNKIL